MSFGKIAIITADPKLSELCGIEVSLAGFEPCFFTSAKHIGTSYLKYLYDVDTVDYAELVEDKTVKMSASKAVAEDSYHLRLPISLPKLREALVFDLVPNIACEYSVTDKFVFNKESRVLYVGERFVALTEHEQRVLEYLCEHRGDTVKREVLNNLLGASDGNIADVYVCHLRKKFEALCGNRMIYTVRAKGYRIDVELKYDE